MASQSSRNFIIQKHSPESIDGRIINFGDRLIVALDEKNASDPGWLERAREEKRKAVYNSTPDATAGVIARACAGMDHLVKMFA